jgi:hypothetical protein
VKRYPLNNSLRRDTPNIKVDMFFTNSAATGSNPGGHLSRSMNLEFCYVVYNQCESFICLNLMVKNREVPIERYFKWSTNTKLVWARYQNY